VRFAPLTIAKMFFTQGGTELIAVFLCGDLISPSLKSQRDDCDNLVAKYRGVVTRLARTEPKDSVGILPAGADTLSKRGLQPLPHAEYIYPARAGTGLASRDSMESLNPRVSSLKCS
jgi:hypothetical protein